MLLEGNDTEADLLHLVPAMRYSIVVFARNAHGEGRRSEEMITSTVRPERKLCVASWKPVSLLGCCPGLGVRLLCWNMENSTETCYMFLLTNTQPQQDSMYWLHTSIIRCKRYIHVWYMSRN